jgi:hypothetical protein
MSTTAALESCVRFNTEDTMTLCISLPDAFFRHTLSHPDMDLVISHAEVLDTLQRAAKDPDLSDEQKARILGLF